MIKDYRLDRQLGNGSSTTVYLGFDEIRLRSCAIKVLNLKPSDGQKYFEKKQELLHEVKIGKLLSPELIIGPYEGGKTDELVYAILPYHEPESAETRNLAKKYPVGTVLLPSKVAEIIESISKALQYCHDHGIIHCDVKPNNVLVGRDGKTKICDFGISLAAGIESRISSGPTHFASPEQIHKKTCFQSDQYSLACIAYLLLTGRYPYDSENKDEIRRMHQEMDIPKMEIGNKGLESVIRKAMAKNPSDRFRKITGFAEEFSRLVH